MSCFQGFNAKRLLLFYLFNTAVTIKYLGISKELLICENITKVISTLILYNDLRQPVISRDSKNKIDGKDFINELKGKHVLFYISSLENISKDELSKVATLYERIDREYKCKIVWIPFEDDWETDTDKKQGQFMKWRQMMPWYAVQYFSSPSYMYLTKEWKVRRNSTAVLINPQGKVENTNALTLIKESGISFFAFLDIKLDTMLKPVVNHITSEDGELRQTMENHGYSFFIGGKDQKTTAGLFGKLTAKLAIHKRLERNIGFVSLTKKLEPAKTFWKGMENLVFSLAHHRKESEYEQVTKEVYKLLSYKLIEEDVDGWIMLTKGWTVVTCGLANTIFTTLEKFPDRNFGEEWGHDFAKHHDNLIPVESRLSCITFQIAGNAPVHLDCPVCEDPMETKLVRYNCCHPRLHNAAN